MAVRLLTFAGSSRRDSLNKKLARLAAKEAGALGASATFIDLKDYEMPLYNGDLEQEKGVPENAQELKKLIRQYDAVFISSPEYNSGVSPLLKNTVDWLSRKHGDETDPIDVFKSAVWGFGAVSSGGFGGVRGLAPLRQTFVSLRALIVSEQTAVKFGNDAFAEDGSLKDEATAKLLKAQLTRMIDLAEKLKA